MTSRGFVGTYFTHDSDEPELLLQQLGELTQCRGVVGQLERCPETGREHIQFYIELKSPRRLTYITRHLPGAHLERRAGTSEQAREYCSKEDTRIDGPWEFGTFKTAQGARTDLDAVHEDLKQGMSLRDLSDTHFKTFLRYSRGIKEYLLLHQERRTWPMEVCVLWGRTGSGKTKEVYDRAAREDCGVFSLPQNDGGVPWFDGYNGEKILLIDDFYGWLKVSWLLKLMDRYPMEVQTKGGSVQFTSKVIYFTSNVSVESWYDWEKFPSEVKAAFMRRITQRLHFN